MGSYKVTVFSPYHFEIGEKIHINEGPRKGDWEVIGISEHKVTLRCPVTKKEFKWDRFCYYIETKELDQWPTKD